MISYVDNVLLSNEHIVYRSKMHWMVVVYPILCFIVMVGVLIPVVIFGEASAWAFLILIIPLVWLCWAILTKIGNEYAITNRRVIFKTGVLEDKAFEIPLNDVNEIVVKQEIFGRIFNYGTLIISYKGASSEQTKAIFGLVEEPLKFKRILDEMRNK